MNEQTIGTLDPDDFHVLCAGFVALDVNEAEGGAFHFEADTTGHRWLVESKAGQVRIERRERRPAESFCGYLPISDRLRPVVGYLGDEPIELSVVDDDALVLTSGPTTAVIDLVERATGFPDEIGIQPTAGATVPLRQLFTILAAARMMPTGVSFDSYPSPPMWMQIDGDIVGLHVDWSDHLPSRATFRTTAANVFGSATFAIPHGCLDALLRSLAARFDDDLTVDVSVGMSNAFDDHRPVIRVEGPEWRCTLFLPDPLGDRWAGAVREALDEAAMVVLDQTDAEWVVSSLGQEVRVKLHAGRPDVARASGVLLYPATESIELLRELSQLNASSIGVRYWLDDEAVRVAADVPCMHLAGLPFAVSSVAQAVRDYAPMMAALGVA